MLHVCHVWIELVGPDHPVFVRPVLRLSSLNTCAPLYNTSPLLGHRVVLVVLGEESKDEPMSLPFQILCEIFLNEFSSMLVDLWDLGASEPGDSRNLDPSFLALLTFFFLILFKVIIVIIVCRTLCYFCAVKVHTELSFDMLTLLCFDRVREVLALHLPSSPVLHRKALPKIREEVPVDLHREDSQV